MNADFFIVITSIPAVSTISETANIAPYQYKTADNPDLFTFVQSEWLTAQEGVDNLQLCVYAYIWL